MNWRLLFFFFLGLLIIAGIAACDQEVDNLPSNTHRINLPFYKTGAQDSVIVFKAELGIAHEFSDGSYFRIPPGVLLYPDGKIVEGEVRLSFQFYRDALDLFQTGILLDNKKGLALMDGGFKISITQNGSPLFIDPTRDVELKIAGYETDEEYSLRFLNPTTEQWDSLFRVSPRVNEQYVALERKINRMAPQIKFPLEADHFAFSYKGILDVIYNNNLTNVSHAQTRKKMKNYGLRWEDVNVETFIDFNGKKVFAPLMVWKNISRKSFPEWTHKVPADLRHLKGKRYLLMVSDSLNGRKFSTQIEAVISLEDLFALGPGFWKNDYKTKVKQLDSANELLIETPACFREFKIHQLGTYTWQKPYYEEEPILIRSHFITKDQDAVQKWHYFYLCGDRKGLVYYPESRWNDFLFFQDPDAKLFGISESGVVVVFPAENWQTIDPAPLRKMIDPSMLFKMDRVMDTIPDTKEEFLKQLNSKP